MENDNYLKPTNGWDRALMRDLKHLVAYGNTEGIRNTARLLLLECNNAIYHQIEFARRR